MSLPYGPLSRLISLPPLTTQPPSLYPISNPFFILGVHAQGHLAALSTIGSRPLAPQHEWLYPTVVFCVKTLNGNYP
jgi:hypothetical protein